MSDSIMSETEKNTILKNWLDQTLELLKTADESQLFQSKATMALGLKGGRMLVKLSAAKAGTMRNTFHSLTSKRNVLETDKFSKAHLLSSPLQYLSGAGIFCFAKLSAEEAAVEEVVTTESSKEAEEAIKATKEETAKKLEEEYKKSVTSLKLIGTYTNYYTNYYTKHNTYNLYAGVTRE